MRKRLLGLLFILLVAGSLNIVAATTTVYKSKWFGFITDSKDVKQGRNITPDAVRKSVQAGAKYALINGLFGGSIVVVPADKVAPFAGQSGYIYGTITTTSLTGGSSGEPNTISPGGGPWTINFSSFTPHAYDSVY